MLEHLAIIGLGSIGRRHLRVARELRPELKITIVRSGRGESSEEEKLADNIFYSLEKAVDAGIQAAVISTPAVCHLEQVKVLMQAGINILVEKPLSHTTDHVHDLIKLQKKRNLVGLVGYCLRHDPCALKFNENLKNKIKSGKILHAYVDCGSYLPEWRPGQNYRQSVSANKNLGGGVLLELSHELDYIRWFFGEMESVYANITSSGTLEIDSEDSAEMIFVSRQGFPIFVHLDFNSRSSRRSCSVRSTNGDLIWDAIKQEVTWDPVVGPKEIERYDHDRDVIYRKQMQHFFDCIEDGQSPAVSITEGAAVLSMIECACRSNAMEKKIVII